MSADPSSRSTSLVATLRRALQAQADPAKAPAMQAYMKSALPFLGVARPVLDRIVVDAAKAQPLESPAALADAMRRLWNDARHREERYAAIELPTCTAAHRKLIAPELLPLVQQMIVTGAWWDHVDDISGGVLEHLLRAFPADVKPLLRRWANGDDLWLRRAAMLCQRKLRGADFDAVLFYETILPSIGRPAAGPSQSGRAPSGGSDRRELGGPPAAGPSQSGRAPSGGSDRRELGGHTPPRLAGEFFIRKGIGWALRERSYTAPDEVQAFCREYDHALSPLTKREALRVIAKREALRSTSAREAKAARK